MTNSPLTDQAMETYRTLMREIKYRTEAIDGVLRADVGPMRQKIAEEFCYLQLRLICEVIAIACLVIHGSLKPKPALFETYKASWIISELDKLHPRFFPNPLEAEDSYESDGVPKWIDKKSGFLTKAELPKLWHRHCGDRLHRGNARDILGKKEKPLDMPQVAKWTTKIVRLLERHTIVTPDEEFLFYVVMQNRETGEVASNLFGLQQRDAYPK